MGMIDIYINPDGDNIWEGELKPNTAERTQQAFRLLPEVMDERKRSLLHAYALAATRRKESMDEAMTMFFEVMQKPGAAQTIAGADKIDVPSLVGLSITQFLNGQGSKVKSHLKKVAAATCAVAEADDFERGWILLAHIFISENKFDEAIKLLKLTLSTNKSNGRAWEQLGKIYEREQSYVNAAECYEHTWELAKGSDPKIGYKLAFNYLKAKRFVAAINVCHRVLRQHPDYPSIMKDVLMPARASLRP